MIEEFEDENWGKFAYIEEPYESQVREALKIIACYLYHHPTMTIEVERDPEDITGRERGICIVERKKNRLFNEDNL